MEERGQCPTQSLEGQSQLAPELALNSSHCVLYHLSPSAQEQVPLLGAKGHVKDRVMAITLRMLGLRLGSYEYFKIVLVVYFSLGFVC